VKQDFVSVDTNKGRFID